MLNFQISVDIDASPDRVWSVMRDIERWAEWTPTVTSIRPLDTGPLQVGSRFIVRQPKLLPTKWRLTQLDDPKRSFTWITVAPGMRLDAHHNVEELNGGSRATLSIEFSGVLGPLFAHLTRKLNDRYLALEAKGLKERSEASTT